MGRKKDRTVKQRNDKKNRIKSREVKKVKIDIKPIIKLLREYENKVEKASQKSQKLVKYQDAVIFQWSIKLLLHPEFLSHLEYIRGNTGLINFEV